MAEHGISMHRALRREYLPSSTFADQDAFGRTFPALPAYHFTGGTPSAPTAPFTGCATR